MCHPYCGKSVLLHIIGIRSGFRPVVSRGLKLTPLFVVHSDRGNLPRVRPQCTNRNLDLVLLPFSFDHIRNKVSIKVADVKNDWGETLVWIKRGGCFLCLLCPSFVLLPS